MKSLMEKVSYVRGLAEGLKIDDTSSEGKVLSQIIGILEQIASEVCEIRQTQDQFAEQMDDMEDRLSDLELDFDFSDGEMNKVFKVDDDDDDQDECFEIECPSCHKRVVIDESELDDDDIVCPNCGEFIEIEFDCDDCDGGCCRSHDFDEEI